MFLFDHSSVLGLDIGSSTLQAVTLRKKRDGTVVLERAGIAAVPAGLISDNAVLDPPAMADCIREFCRDQRLGQKRVAVGVAGEGVFISRLRLERAASEPLQARLRQQAARVAPFPLKGAALDFQVLESFSDAGWVDALVVAAAPQKVEHLRALLSRAGKVPVLVDSTACALVNAFEFNYEPPSSQVVALLHLDATAITVCVVLGATPVLARDLPLARGQYSDQEWSLADRVAVQLERVFEEMDEISDERPLEPRSSQVEKLLLSGDGARWPDLENVLRNRIGLPFEEVNPFRRIEFEVNGLSRRLWDQAHCMPVAVGLALRGFDDL